MNILWDENNGKGYSRDSGPGGYMEITRGFSAYSEDYFGVCDVHESAINAKEL